MRTLTTIDMKASTSAVEAPDHSPMHSPVPYLFGGLAAMLGLIAFALLILACSYWKLSGFSGDHPHPHHNQRDSENGDEEKSSGDSNNIKVVYEQKIVVIMAGDQNPSFLANPVCMKASNFGDNIYSKNQNNNKEEEDY